MNPQNQPDKSKSLVYLLSGILFVLVLLEKSIGSGTQLPTSIPLPPTPQNSITEEGWAKGFAGFKNIGRSEKFDEIPVAEIPKSLEKIQSPQGDAWEIQVEDEINQAISDDEIPILSSNDRAVQEGHINIFFIKFFGSDNRAESRLVRVPRVIPSGIDPIHFVLNELKKGPRQEEKSKGVLNALPQNFTYSPQYELKDGILKIDLNESFEFGAGPEILKDRMDQIAHSLIGIAGIRGIQITIEQKKVTTLGGDGVPIPNVLGKRQRKITTL